MYQDLLKIESKNQTTLKIMENVEKIMEEGDKIEDLLDGFSDKLMDVLH